MMAAYSKVLLAGCLLHCSLLLQVVALPMAASAEAPLQLIPPSSPLANAIKDVDQIDFEEEIHGEDEANAASDDESLVGLLAKTIQDPSSVSATSTTEAAASPTPAPIATARPTMVDPKRIDKIFSSALKWSGEFEEYIGLRMRETWEQIRKLLPPQSQTNIASD